MARLARSKVKSRWQLADAKNRFSELVNLAISRGPQRVTRRGDVVFVVSEKDYERMSGKRPDFRSFLLGSTPSLEGLNLERDKAPPTPVDL